MSLADLILNRSKQRRELLTLFFANEEKEYYLRELERMTGISVGNVRRELNKLLEDRLFTTRKRGNLLLYRLNTKHPHYNELKKILVPVIGLEGVLRDSLTKVGGMDVAFLYGSTAARRARSDSDVDLLIIGTPDKQKLLKGIATLEKRLQKEINYKVYTKPSFRRKRAEKNSFILEVLEEPKRFLLGEKDDL